MAGARNQLVANRLFPDPNDPFASQAPTPADAWDSSAAAYQQWLDQQRQSGVQAGMLDPQTGWPTGNALIDAARQYGSALIGGTSGPGFKVYHGSPHSFDRFDLGKIGTGEGAQAYGHGLYFADNERVAQSYRDALSNPTYDGQPYDSNDPAHRAGYYIWQLNRGDRQAALAQIDRETAEMQQKMVDRPQSARIYQDGLDRHAQLKDHIESGAPVADVSAPGHMYEVNVDADPAHFLDWDKPRDQLSSPVQAFAQKNTPQAWENAADGSSLYHGMAKELGSHAAASEAMAQAGIPGIRYLDGGSRADGSGTSNHVIFDPATIDILRKYGIGALIGGGAAAGAAQPDQSQ